MHTIRLRVKNQDLIPDYCLHRAIGNTDSYTCHFQFLTDDWKSMTSKVAVFKSTTFDISKVVVLSNDDTCVIPWEVSSKPGVVLCSLTGYVAEGNIVTHKVITDPEPILVVQDITTENVNDAPAPTPSEYEQFIENMNTALARYFETVGIDYSCLENLPSIEGVPVEGELFFADFGYLVASVSDIDAMFL